MGEFGELHGRRAGGLVASVQGNPASVLDCKLCLLGRRLKSWSNKKVGNIQHHIEWAKDLIMLFDIASESVTAGNTESCTAVAEKQKGSSAVPGKRKLKTDAAVAEKLGERLPGQKLGE